MKAKYLGICFVILLLVILSWCTVNNFSSNEVPTANYVFGFPKEPSPALTEYISDYLLEESHRKLFKENDAFVFADGTRDENDRIMSYYYYTEARIEKYYERVFNARRPYSDLGILKAPSYINESLLLPIEDPLIYSLPILEMQEGNQLKIKTALNETVLDLPKLLKEYGIKENDQFVFNLLESSENHFILEIEEGNIKNSRGYSGLFLNLFIKKDLSEIAVSEQFDEAIQKKLDTGDLDSFLNDFKKIDSKGRYVFLYNWKIIDIETKKIVKIRNGDYLSEDGKYVYINGRQDHLADGIQRIQTIDNYEAENDIYEIEFELNYEEIAKVLKYLTNGERIADLSYFNEDYVIVNIDYRHPMVGSAGYLDIIVDLQGNREDPTLYLVDLDKDYETNDY
ncbi:hypothetical protein [Metabacillus fastidiosus]|uniref:hypothetical protein n=1 Tax=Metabacillus fastidiosus TaxID=1458 RepID=UPI003D29A9A5